MVRIVPCPSTTVFDLPTPGSFDTVPHEHATTSKPTPRVEVVLDWANFESGLRGYGPVTVSWVELIKALVVDFAQRAGLCPGLDKQGDDYSAAGQELDASVWCVATCPSNVHPDDSRHQLGRRRFLKKLESEYGFSVVSVPVDFHGFHVTGADRRQSPLEAERTWSLEGKGCDTAVAVTLLCRALSQPQPDGIIFVTGDADGAPALHAVARSRPSIPTTVAAFAGSLSSVYRKGNPAGYQWRFGPILLDHLVAQIERRCA